MIRDNLQHSKPRCHYNYKGKTKQSFETEEQAIQFINKTKLKDYTVYLCRICNKYHIGKEKGDDS